MAGMEIECLGIYMTLWLIIKINAALSIVMMQDTGNIPNNH